MTWRAARTGRRGTAVGDDDRGLHPELIGRAGLALADALGLGGMEGIQIPAALALLLRADLTGAREWCFERGLDVVPAGDLTADIPDQPAKAGCAGCVAADGGG